MSNDDGRLLFWSFVGFGAGIYTFMKGFRQFRQYRVVADTPTIRIRSVPMGLVQIRGVACAEETLVSPVTHTPCYLFKVNVEQWHSDSDGGGEWKHVATDLQSVKFDLQDESGNILVEAANAELDLPDGPIRKVGSNSSAPNANFSLQNPVVGALSGASVSDAELVQYIEQARMRHVGQIVGKGISLVTHAIDPSHDQQRNSFLSMLTDPSGAGALGFQSQMVRAMLARKDPNGEITRLALEVFKHPQWTPEFDAALVKVAQAYTRTMGMTKQGLDPSTILSQARQNPQALAMVAMVAGAAEPQADPESEKARQAALAFERGNPLARAQTSIRSAATGHYRLKEWCVLPGETYDITGTCAENPHPRDEHDRNIILKGANEPTFLISSRTGAEVQSYLWKRSLWMVLGGAALAVVCLAIILGKLGLL
jgi:hypothetical protein